MNEYREMNAKQSNGNLCKDFKGFTLKSFKTFCHDFWSVCHNKRGGILLLTDMSLTTST